MRGEEKEVDSLGKVSDVRQDAHIVVPMGGHVFSGRTGVTRLSGRRAWLYS